MKKEEEETNYEDLPGNNSESSIPKEELDEMTRALNESQQQVLRLKAELENQRKRLQREIENSRNYAAFNFITSMLPVKDSMEKGLDVAYMEDGNIKAEELFEGMSSTLRVMNDAFKNAGLEVIDPLGETFDPEAHEAMTIRKVEGEPPQKILAVYQKGYKLNGRLVRPARVEVSAGYEL